MSFLGRKVKIQTRDYTVEGTVASIENQRLVLSDVKSIGTGERLDKMIVEGTQVIDVEILQEAPAIQSPRPQKPDDSQIKQTKEIREAQKEFDFAANLDKFDKRAEFEKIANESRITETVSDKIPSNEMVTASKPQPQRKGVVKRPDSKGSKAASPQPASQASDQVRAQPSPQSSSEQPKQQPKQSSNRVSAVKVQSPAPVVNGPPVPNMQSVPDMQSVTNTQPVSQQSVSSLQPVTQPVPNLQPVTQPVPNLQPVPQQSVSDSQPAPQQMTPTPTASSPAPLGPSLQTQLGPIPIATALQLSQILTQMGGLGFHSAAIAERAAEGLEEILKDCAGPVVILVAAHTVGHWAIAAGRRLALEGKTVVAVSPTNDAVEKLGDQTKSFVASGGHFVTTQKALFAALQNQSPAVIIDALEGYEMPLVDQLDENEFQAASWLINWANSVAATKLSLCTACIGNSELACFGFPLSPCTYIIDIGVPVKALKALKLRRFGGVRFASKIAKVQ